MSSNTWLSKDGLKQIDFYLNSQDVIILERKRAIKLLIDLFNYHFKNKIDLNILDLGCGNGIITKRISELFESNNFYLYDGSESMLNKAKEEFTDKNYHFKLLTFEEYIQSEDKEHFFDFVFSSMAIHHLTSNDKLRLYEKIYKELKFEGMFLNFDVVKPVTKQTELYQFKLWQDWMNEKIILSNNNDDIGKHDNLPEVYKFKAENKPSTIMDQLRFLSEAGFNDVDVYYKYSIFTLFGGIK